MNSSSSEPGGRSPDPRPTPRDDAGSRRTGDHRTRVTLVVALVANVLIATAKVIGGLFAHSPALLSEAAHSLADSFNEVFLLAALRRSRRPADRCHPFGYGKERFLWSLLAAVGIFVTGHCFSVFQGVRALEDGADETFNGYVTGLTVLGVALCAEGASLLRALLQVRRHSGKGLRDPALRTVVAEDGAAVLGVSLALLGMGLHMVTGYVAWEAAASLSIGALLIYVAYRLGRDAREHLIGEAASPELRDRIRSFLRAQPEIDAVSELFTMQMGTDSTLVAARIDLTPGLDSERVEEVASRIKSSLSRRVPEADQVFLDIEDRSRRDLRAPAIPDRTGGASGRAERRLRWRMVRVVMRDGSFHSYITG
ncbi:cation diffusion facilitator family transporter [Streptomyces spinosus]|uniref:cation diffusion facilitator family transporter n=1 Tax=Streptomyces spinosus TaxID=2872623 RepID=UPI001CED8518|nr:cation diffusion facilitator family transporter [Streptomyces spinosus]